MANEVSKGSGGQVQRPGDVFTALRNEMDRMLDSFERGWPRFGALAREIGGDRMMPQADVRDDGSQVTIEVDLPGVDEKDINLTIVDGVLTLKGEKKSEREEKKDNYYLSERSYGSFQRSIRLPDSVDESKVEAHFEKGVLKVTAPKRPEAVKTEKRIEIRKA